MFKNLKKSIRFIIYKKIRCKKTLSNLFINYCHYFLVDRAENGGSQNSDGHPVQPEDLEERVIFVNAPQQPAKYKNNHITTAKYTILTFIPSFLFEQFRRYSNCFFLFVALMQVIIIIFSSLRYPQCHHIINVFIN